MNIFVLSFDVDGFIHPAVTRLVRHGVLDAPRTHSLLGVRWVGARLGAKGLRVHYL
jgi:hypothetical protein